MISLVVEIIEEGGFAVEGWFALSFYFDGDMNFGLADAPQVLNVAEYCFRANAAACDDGLAEAHIVHAVVDQHLDVAHVDNLVPHIGQQRQCQIAVGNGAPVGTFHLRTRWIYMYPLMVVGGIGEKVDAVLVYLHPFRYSQHLAEMRGELFVGVDN